MGLVNRLVDDESLEAYRRGDCATIADAPTTLHALKRTVGALLLGEDADLAGCEALVRGVSTARSISRGDGRSWRSGAGFYRPLSVKVSVLVVGRGIALDLAEFKVSMSAVAPAAKAMDESCPG
jgi:hypothetical protein